MVFKEIFWSLASCCLSAMKRNSVFEELRVKRLEIIQEEICCIVPWRCVMLHLEDERKRKVVCHRHTGGDLEKEMR